MKFTLPQPMRLLLCLSCLVLVSPSARSQSIYDPPYAITTFAGVPQFAGSFDGTGTAKFDLWYPKGVAFDTAGNLYVANSTKNNILKITPAGAVSTFAVGGNGNPPNFNLPADVAVDGGGNVYVADQLTHTIRKITPSGQISTLAGLAQTSGSTNGTGSAARFNDPSSVAVDSSGNVFVADRRNHLIRKITPGGVVTTVAGLAGANGHVNGAAADARFYFPTGIAVDGSGTLYIADQYNDAIRKITTDGTVSTLASGVPPFASPSDIAIDGAGFLYVANQDSHTVLKITPEGVVSTLAGATNQPGLVNGNTAEARFNQPTGITVDPSGNVYVGDQFNHAVRKITSAGVVSTVAGSPGFFSSPTSIILDPDGNAYVADSNNHTIRKITPNAAVSTIAGLAEFNGATDGVGAEARFKNPNGLARDSAGTLYVADEGNHTIRKITPAGEVSTLAGSPGETGSQDGIGSAARFNSPAALALDSTGNLFVADRFNHTIRKITPEGAVTTFAGLAQNFGSANGVGIAARFDTPSGLAIDSLDNVYVADWRNRTIRKITPAAVVTTFAGVAGESGGNDGAASNARFTYPTGLAVDGANYVYVTDTYHHAIRRISPAGVVRTLAGRIFGTNSHQDGIGENAWFWGPGGIAVRPSGAIVVADSGNQVIRAGIPAIVVSTAVSRKTHGESGEFAINLLGGALGIECRSGGAQGEHTFVLTFSNQIVSGTAAVSGGTGNVSGTPAISGNTMTIQLTGVANAQRLTVTLSNVTDVFGQVMPNTAIRADFLLGDTNADWSVNSGDATQTRARSGEATGAANFRSDVNVDGTINSGDALAVRARSGTSIP